jgi:xanthine dehydrogenase accessory factor
VAVAVADLGRRLGYRIVAAALADDLAAFADEDQKITGFDLAAAGVEAEDYVVVATQGRRDREALAAALGTLARYVAFVGSRRKAEVLKAQIAAQGCTSEQIARLKAPAGLDIHGIEPEEIALSILAEIVACRRAVVKDGDVTDVAESAPRSCCG